jgi:adenylate kinase
LKKPTCILIFGPQGSGKGTQSAKIVEKYGYPYFEMGAVLREMSELDPGIAYWLSEGILVPEESVEKPVGNFINSYSNSTFLLDGFPRGERQANFLTVTLAALSIELIIIELKSYDDKVLIERMLERCRADDTAEVIKKRLEGYSNFVAETLDHLSEITNSSIYTIDCSQDIDSVFIDIDAALEICITN